MARQRKSNIPPAMVKLFEDISKQVLVYGEPVRIETRTRTKSEAITLRHFFYKWRLRCGQDHRYDALGLGSVIVQIPEPGLACIFDTSTEKINDYLAQIGSTPPSLSTLSAEMWDKLLAAIHANVGDSPALPKLPVLSPPSTGQGFSADEILGLEPEPSFQHNALAAAGFDSLALLKDFHAGKIAIPKVEGAPEKPRGIGGLSGPSYPPCPKCGGPLLRDHACELQAGAQEPA